MRPTSQYKSRGSRVRATMNWVAINISETVMLAARIVAAVIVIVRTLSDTTIYLPEDVEKLNGITVLGQIPEIEAPEGKYNYWKMEEGGVIRHDEEKNLQ